MDERERFQIARGAGRLEAHGREALDNPRAGLDATGCAATAAFEGRRSQERHVRHQPIPVDVMPDGLARRHRRRLRRDGPLLESARGLDVGKQQDNDAERDQTARSSNSHSGSLA
jgi:hypothetical protein